MIRSVAVLGAGTMGAQIAAHFANADTPALLLDVTADAARQGLERARQLKPDPFFTPDTATGSSKPSSSNSTSSAGCCSGLMTRGDLARLSARTPRVFRLRRSPKGAATTSESTGWAHTSSTRLDICVCSK